MILQSRRGVTVIEIVIVCAGIALLVAVLIPVIGSTRGPSRQQQVLAQFQRIQQGLFVYAQSNDGLYPGLDRLELDGPNDACTDADRIRTYATGARQAGAEVGARFAIGLEQELFAPESLISPFESDPRVRPWDPRTIYRDTDLFYSFALPAIRRSELRMSEGRTLEWRASANGSAVAVSDRLPHRGGGSPDPADASTHAGLAPPGTPGQWSGGVTFNDNHAEWLSSSLIRKGRVYAGVRTRGPDNLFSDEPAGEQDTPVSEDEDPGIERQFNAYQVIHGGG